MLTRIEIIFVLLAFLGSIKAAHNYFEYEDCGNSCVNQKVSCVISEENGDFITKCCSSEDCIAAENNWVVCLRPGEAPLGGSDIWEDFREKVHPTTTTEAPETPEDCTKFKVLLGIGWSASASFIAFQIMKLILKKIRKRRNAERLLSDEQPTVQDIENVRE
jgi:hypothetical protein